MENLYYEKGGVETPFNVVNVKLTVEDLNRLEADVKEKQLPETTGFFFGHTDGTEYEEDLAFIEAARKTTSEGKTVFYTSWW